MESATLDAPQATSKPAFDPSLPFTDPEFARNAALKSVEARRTAAEQLRYLISLKLSPTATQTPATGIPEQGQTSNLTQSVQQAVQDQLSIVEKQIARTLEVLDDDNEGYCEHCERSGMQPHHRAQLLKALDTLLDRQRILLGIPLPGSNKPSRQPRRDTRPPVEPV